jgi:antitoxin (DNA-binding transcriptional repressor) of toxin-antitoxin stability system
MSSRMRDVDANEAGQMLDQLVDEVERGETVRILRDGRPIARLIAEPDARRADAAEAIERLKALRQELGKAPLDEVLANIHEGHKY